MMDRTDRHFRFLMRQLSRRALLYTEMVTMDAVIHGRRDKLIGFSEQERPLALQLGGDDPDKLATCAQIAEDLGYDEVNLNVGCPSDRVQQGNFGAILMRRPETVAACVDRMRSAVGIPVTVKHRIGVDELDRYEDLLRFVDIVSKSGADRFTVHARKAWLSGLSPKQNRTIPPLRPEAVHRLKRERPELLIETNGGIRDLDAAARELEHVDGVMIGRAAFETPYVLAGVDPRFYGEGSVPSRVEVVERMIPYLERETARGERLVSITRHMLTLFTGQPGARAWRRLLTEQSSRPGADATVVQRALQAMRGIRERRLLSVA